MPLQSPLLSIRIQMVEVCKSQCEWQECRQQRKSSSVRQMHGAESSEQNVKWSLTLMSSSYNAHAVQIHSPCLCTLQDTSTSSHTPGCPAAEHDEENGAVVTRRPHTGYLTPSSLDPALLKMRDEICEESGVLWAHLVYTDFHFPHVTVFLSIL